MQQRTGKTLTALAIVAERDAERVLVVAPKRAIPVWHQQIAEHTVNPPDIQLVNFETVWRDRKHWAKWLPDIVIVDESHRIKNRSSKQSKAVARIGLLAQLRLALTGTPIGNGYQDLWAQFRFLFPVKIGKAIISRVFGAWEDFAERHLVMGGYYNHKIVGYNDEDTIKRLYDENSYRVTLNEARGAHCRTVRRIHYIESLTLQEQRAYDELEEGLVTLANQTEIEAPLVITQVMKMQQVTGGSILDDLGNAWRLGTSKLTKLMGLIQEAREPVVVIFRFLHEIEAVRQRLDPDMRVVVISGGNYELPSLFDVALLQVQSGIAIDLAQSARIIFYSWDYSYLSYEQARFRIMSYNSTKVTYDYLVARGTIDETIYRALTRKRNLATMVVDQYRRKKMETQEVEQKAQAVKREITRKGAVKKPAKSAKAAPAKATKAAKTSEEGRVVLEDLAAEAKMASTKARRILRAAEVERPEGRWSWKEGSNALRAARKALGL